MGFQLNICAGKFLLELNRPLVMGIVNVTPDSFADGGRYLTSNDAIAHGRRLIEDGADILDVGGESTRPGASAASLQEELDRIMPVIESLVADGIPVSVDTQKTPVMAATIAAGAAMINDVSALQAPGAIDVCAASNVAVCLMHKQGSPENMQDAPRYLDVIAEVTAFLSARTKRCIDAGISHNRIAIDPGFGFGKTVEHNFTLLRELKSLAALGFPVLAGFSRKASLGVVTRRTVEDRLAASIAAAILCAQNGATILRVHDVRETVDAMKILAAARNFSRP